MPEKFSQPFKKKRKSVKKGGNVSEINARVAEIMNAKAKSFDKMRKKNVHMFKEGNQGHFRCILQREASKVENLMVSVWHLNEDGLVSRRIGPKTVSMMSKLLNKTSEWQTPQSRPRALFLKLDKSQSSSGLLYDYCIV